MIAGASHVQHAMQRLQERYGLAISLEDYSRMSMIAAGYRKHEDPDWQEQYGVPLYIGRDKKKRGAYVEIAWRGQVLEAVVGTPKRGRVKRRRPTKILTFLPPGSFASHPHYFAIKPSAPSPAPHSP